MSKQREALELALEVLEEINKLSIGENAICLPAEIDTAMDAIREALAEPEQEPATWQYRWLNPNKMDCEPFEMDWKAVAAGPGLTLDAAISDLEAYKDRSGKSVYEVRPLYVTPPARKPLTDSEVFNLAADYYEGYGFKAVEFARAIERAHGIGEA